MRSSPFSVQQLIIKQTNETLSRLAGLISKIFQNISIRNNQIFIQHFRNSAVRSGVMLSELSIFTVGPVHIIFIFKYQEISQRLNKYSTNCNLSLKFTRPSRNQKYRWLAGSGHDTRFPVLCLNTFIVERDLSNYYKC